MNLKLSFLIYLTALFFLSACKSVVTESLVLQSEKIITTIPSASGLICHNNSMLLVGDDASFIFEIDDQLKIQNTYRISFMNKMENGRINSSIKPDFEAIDLFDGKLLVMGSGSKLMSRDTAVLFDLKSREIITKVSFRPLFQKFLKIGAYDSLQSINMEGLASDRNNFYFLHRGNICGNNIVFQIKKEELLNYIRTSELPNITFKKFDLPTINGYQSGFSGACVSPDESLLIFTCSVESTGDVYHDGEVLGSFIGYISMTGENAWKDVSVYPVMGSDSLVKTKLESVCVSKVSNEQYWLTAVSDNDNGQSGVYQFLFSINN